MNKILEIEGYRFYQSSYDEDGQGSWLSVNYDPWGTTLSYVGYILLAISMFIVLIDRREEFRRLLRNPLLRKGTLIIMLAAMSPSLSAASRSLPAFNREKPIHWQPSRWSTTDALPRSTPWHTISF